MKLAKIGRWFLPLEPNAAYSGRKSNSFCLFSTWYGSASTEMSSTNKKKTTTEEQQQSLSFISIPLCNQTSFQKNDITNLSDYKLSDTEQFFFFFFVQHPLQCSHL